MASSRVSAGRSLKRVAVNTRQIRQLHITESIKHPARLAVSDSAALGPLSESSRVKSEQHDSPRAFSTSDPSYGNTQQPSYHTGASDVLSLSPAPFAPTNQKPRQFNTSRQLKAVGDTSTIDFAYLPEFPPPAEDEGEFQVRVPILPLIYAGAPPAAHPPRVAEILADHDTPTIATVAGEATHISAPSPMADVHDAGGHTLDFHEVAEALTDAAKKVTLGTEREADAEVKRAKGLLKQAWTGLLADVFGGQQQQKQQKPRAS